MTLRRWLSALLLTLVVTAPFVPAPAGAQIPGAPGVSSAAAILVNIDDESRVLFQRNVHERRPIASLTKIVTALVARDEYDLDEVVVATDHIYGTEGSSVGLRVGMEFTVRDMLYIILLKSANDGAAVLAAHHPAGYDHFIELMNAKARALGAVDSSFANPHGLDAEGHYSSAWDMAIFARQVLADPLLASIVQTPSHTITWEDGTPRTYANHNKLLDRYEGAVGLKTGFTSLAGHTLISAARTSTGVLVTVVLDSQDHYADTTALFDYGKALALAEEPGGGGAEPTSLRLDRPPPAPADAGLMAAADVPAIGADPREDSRWVALMGLLALLCAATVVRVRRPDPIRQAAEHHPWLLHD